MSEGLLTYRGAVYPWHCDHMGHMNVMWYVGKFDEATWNFFSEIGLTRAYMDANDRGMAAVEQVINYKKELMAGDTVTVHSAVIEVKDKVLRFSHEMRNSQGAEVAATAVLTTVFLDRTARKATPFPADIRAHILEMSKGH
jgi:acyl-CoA thioester hydrolase